MVADDGPSLDLMETPEAETLPIMNPGGEKSCCPSRFREKMELIEPAGVRKAALPARWSLLASERLSLLLLKANVAPGQAFTFRRGDSRRSNSERRLGWPY